MGRTHVERVAASEPGFARQVEEGYALDYREREGELRRYILIGVIVGCWERVEPRDRACHPPEDARRHWPRIRVASRSYAGYARLHSKVCCSARKWSSSASSPGVTHVARARVCSRTRRAASFVAAGVRGEVSCVRGGVGGVVRWEGRGTYVVEGVLEGGLEVREGRGHGIVNINTDIQT